MIPVTPKRDPISFDCLDPLARLFLSQAAYADMLAPPVPFIVERRCGSNYQARLVFQAIMVARMLYGRDDVSYSEIATFAQGISRTRFGDYIGFLCSAALIEVVGHRDDERFKGTNGPGGKHAGVNRAAYRTARYRIDMARLVQESAAAWAELIHELAAGIPTGNPSRREPMPGQLTLDILEPPSDENDAATPRETVGPSTDTGKPEPFSYGNGSLAPSGALARLARTGEPQPFPYENGSLAPSGALARLAHTGEPQPFSYENRSQPASAACLEPFSDEHGSRSPTNMAVPRQKPPPFSDEHMGGGMGGLEGREEGGRGAEALSLIDVRSVIRAEVAQAIQSALAMVTHSQSIPPAMQQPAYVDAVPPAPADEPEIDVGPIGAWEQLLSRSASSGEQGQIREIVRTFAASSSGSAAYWLVRAMFTVAIEDPNKLTLRYVRGVLKRLARTGRWDSKELALAAGEERQLVGAVELEPTTQPERRRRGQKQQVVSALPAELLESQPIQVYQAHAPAGVVLTEVWAQEIHQRVQHIPVWQAVCLNWRERNDYSAVAKMLDRYDRDAAALAGGHRADGDGEGFDSKAAQTFVASHVGPSEADLESEAENVSALSEPQSPAQREVDLARIRTWQFVLGTIREQVDRATFQTWFFHTHLAQLDQDTATVVVGHDVHRDHLERAHLPLIRRALSDALGRVVVVRVVVREEP